jgi:hypothetical protein
MRGCDKLALLLAAVFLAIMGLAMLVRAPRPADDPIEPATVPSALVLRVNGDVRCTCTPTRDGCYTAAHCFQALPAGARFTLNGQAVTSYSIDPARDLAHIPMGADPSVTFGAPVEGQLGTWLGAVSGGGVARVISTAVPMGPYSFPALHVRMARQPYDVWAVGRDSLPGSVRMDDPGPVLPGDSGGGFYLGGNLVGILSLHGGYGAETVRVP